MFGGRGNALPYLTIVQVPLPSSVPGTTSSTSSREFPLQPSSRVLGKQPSSTELRVAAVGWFRALDLPVCAPPGLCSFGTHRCEGALSLLVPHTQQHPFPCLASLSLPQGKEVEERQMAFCRLDVTHILLVHHMQTDA